MILQLAIDCHKSIEQGLILTGATPIYMIPIRNRYGIIGPIHRSEITPKAQASLRAVRKEVIKTKQPEGAEVNIQPLWV